MNYFDGMSTPIGRLHIIVSDKALLRVYFQNERWKEKFIRAPKHQLIVRTKKQLQEYFAGERRRFDLPIHVDGTDFQKKAWGVLREIPYGETINYSEQARRMKKGKAVRAVGSANGRNPLPIIVPCHRVVAKDGGLGWSLRGRNSTWIFTVDASSCRRALSSLHKNLGGYSGGLLIKKKLLALEQKFLDT